MKLFDNCSTLTDSEWKVKYKVLRHTKTVVGSIFINIDDTIRIIFKNSMLREETFFLISELR